MSICFFIGHRDSPISLYPALRDAVMRHADEYGVTEFLVGHYGAFDRMASRAAAEAKQAHPTLRLTLLLPYHPAEQPVPLPEGFTGSLYPPEMERVPRRMAIVRANRYAIERADFLIAYAVRPGSSSSFLEYARSRKELHISFLNN